jgi:hypothetical protein
MMKFFRRFIVQIVILFGAVILLIFALRITGHVPPKTAADSRVLVQLSLGLGIVVAVAGTAWRLVRYYRQVRRKSS